MKSSTHTSTDQRIAEEAAHWLIDLEEGQADLSDFSAWLKASPRHVEEFLLTSAVWHAADGMDATRRLDVEQLVAQARDNVKRLDEESIQVSPALGVRHRMRMALSSRLTVAVAMLAAMGLGWIALRESPLHYRTAVGEQRIVKLQDGSIVTLNTRSRVKVHLEEEQRVVELVEGEALFDVAHDAHRPFRVLAGPAVVRAVGTQFNVHRTRSGTTVAVVEGIVELSSRDSSHQSNPAPGDAVQDSRERLAAGEQARISPQGRVSHHQTTEIARVTAWRERRLIFRNEPLTTIAEEFNRYNDTQLVIAGPATRARLVTGVFDADNPGALVAFLERDPQLSVRASGNDVVISGP